MTREINRLPTSWSSIQNVWLRNFRHFRKAWMANVFWIILEPLFFLLAIGYGIGSFIPDISGYSYVEFFFPALLCISSMMISFFEGTYGNFSKLTYQKTYSTMLLTPLETKHIVIGEILWGASKGTLSALGVSLVASIFGHLNGWMIIPALMVIFISSFLFSGLGMLVTSFVKNYDGIIYPTSGLMVPMSLFSGTYFPLEQIAVGLKYASYILPLTHSVVVVRGLFLEQFQWIWLINILVLLILCYVITKSAIKRIDQKLIK